MLNATNKTVNEETPCPIIYTQHGNTTPNVVSAYLFWHNARFHPSGCRDVPHQDTLKEVMHDDNDLIQVASDMWIVDIDPPVLPKDWKFHQVVGDTPFPNFNEFTNYMESSHHPK